MSRRARWVLGTFSAVFGVMLVFSRLTAPSAVHGRVYLMSAFCFDLTVACFSTRWRDPAVRVIGAMLFVAIAFFIKDELRAQSVAKYNGDYEPHWFNAIGAALLFAFPALYVAIRGRFPTPADMPLIGRFLAGGKVCPMRKTLTDRASSAERSERMIMTTNATRCAAAVLLFVVFAFAQQPAKNPPDWTPFKTLIGEWRGQGNGEPGQSKVERSYKFGVGGTFIIVDNRSVYPPQKANPPGETHVDHGLISFDKSRKKYVLRQFHVEGFVNQYVLDEIAPDGKKLVWVTEAIENIPAGWRARETYLIKSQNEFTEVFELAAPGKDFEVYTRNEFRRIK